MQKSVLGDVQKKLDQTWRLIEAAEDAREINGIVERLVSELLDSEFASLWIFDEKRGVLIRERGDESLNEISIKEQQGVIARSFLTMTGGIYNYLASEKEYVPRFDNPDNIRIKSKIITPLVDGDRFIGLATAYNSVRRIQNFTERDLKLLEALRPFLIEAVYRIRPDLREERIERVYLDTAVKKPMAAVSKNVETMMQEQREEKTAPDELLKFLANTVHDIRTPANSLAGFLELLEDRIDDARILQFVRNARESAEFIHELTDSILERVSLHHGKKREPVVLNPIKFFTDIASNFSANMYDKQVDYTVYLDPQLPAEIRLDAFRLKRVVMNLLGNAIKFTPRGKSVELSVTYDASRRRMKISVTDTGIGIAKEKQEKIFEAFAQAEEHTALEYGGTGLGLSISAQYVAEMGGKLQLESALEQGSRFFFEIPLDVVEEKSHFPPLNVVPEHLAILTDRKQTIPTGTLLKYLQGLGLDTGKIHLGSAVDELPAGTTHLIAFGSLLDEETLKQLQARDISLLVMEEELFALSGEPAFADLPIVSTYAVYLPELYSFLSTVGESAPRSRRVLVVDDNRINIELLRAILEEELYQVQTASDGEEGLRLLEEALTKGEPFDLAFVDRHLPGMNGTELVEAYRKAEAHISGRKKLYAVSITGDPTESDKERHFFDSVMRKPFSRKEVKAILMNLEAQ